MEREKNPDEVLVDALNQALAQAPRLTGFPGSWVNNQQFIQWARERLGMEKDHETT